MSRGNDRYAFRRFCEQEEQTRLDTERECEQASDLHMIACEILGWFDLDMHTDRFLNSFDSLALLANCCNCAAKWFDDDLYVYKPLLVRLASLHPDADAWASEGIVYLETGLGQVSFHALWGEDAGLPEANGRVWNGLEYQMNAPLVAQAFIEGWSEDALLRKMDERQQEEIAA